MNRGVVCVGDSVINADRSWGYWLAQASGWPLMRVSRGGATSTQVLGQLEPLAGERFRVAALTVGTNDVLFDWDAVKFEGNVRAILEALTAASEAVLVATLPRNLMRFPGSPPARRAAVGVANRVLTSVASEAGCSVVDGSDITGWRLMGADRVHPTVQGQLVLADRAAQALGIPAPSALRPEIPRLRPAQYLRTTADRTVREVGKRLLRR